MRRAAGLLDAGVDELCLRGVDRRHQGNRENGDEAHRQPQSRPF
jgi:hypothetical protein